MIMRKRATAAQMDIVFDNCVGAEKYIILAISVENSVIGFAPYHLTRRDIEHPNTHMPHYSESLAIG